MLTKIYNTEYFLENTGLLLYTGVLPVVQMELDFE